VLLNRYRGSDTVRQLWLQTQGFFANGLLSRRLRCPLRIYERQTRLVVFDLLSSLSAFILPPSGVLEHLYALFAPPSSAAGMLHYLPLPLRDQQPNRQASLIILCSPSSPCQPAPLRLSRIIGGPALCTSAAGTLHVLYVNVELWKYEAAQLTLAKKRGVCPKLIAFTLFTFQQGCRHRVGPT
jgi:hypothetical protein